MTSTAADAAIISGTSTRTIWSATTRVPPNAAAAPSTSSTFAMLEPTTLPTARPVCPLNAEPTLTASSGALVPNATTVRPTTMGDRPNRTATRPAPLTNTSAPATSSTKPPTRST